MDVGVANAVEMREHRHAGIGLYARDEALAAARHNHIDQARCREHGANSGAVLRRQQLDGSKGNAGRR